jgi:hypothetical protein
LHMVISWSFRYFASSFVVMICGIMNSSKSFLESLFDSL